MKKMRELLKKPFAIPIAALLFTLAFCVYILPINELIAFNISDLGERAQRYRLYYKLFFGPILFGATYFVLHFVSKVLQRDKTYIRWLKISAGYFAFMAVFFLLMYPGHWVWDEFVILKAVKEYGHFAWQGIFTNAYYTFCLYLFPTALTIILFQLVFVSVVVGYVATRVRSLLPKGRAAWLALIPFAFIPVILNNLYPLRLTLYAYLLLIFFVRLILLHYKKFATDNPGKEFFWLSLILTLLAFWRTEGIIYLALVPYLAYRLRLFTVRGALVSRTIAWCVAGMLALALGHHLASLTTDPLYKLTATINPLSTMIQGDLKGPRVSQDLSSVGKVLDLEVLKKYPSYEEVPAFWSGVVRDDFLPHTSEYNHAVLDLIKSNPGPFLENRSKLFLSTNMLGKTLPFVGEAKRFYSTEAANPARKAVVDEFFATNKLTHPISMRLHQKTTQALLLLNDSWSPTPIGRIVWSLFPVITALAGVGAWLIIRRMYFWAFLCGILLLHALILFLTAPANFFMYYFPVYLCGNFLVVFILLLAKYGRLGHAK